MLAILMKCDCCCERTKEFDFRPGSMAAAVESLRQHAEATQWVLIPGDPNTWCCPACFRKAERIAATMEDKP